MGLWPTHGDENWLKGTLFSPYIQEARRWALQAAEKVGEPRSFFGFSLTTKAGAPYLTAFNVAKTNRNRFIPEPELMCKSDAESS
jgi:hypothetical protein